MRKSRAKIIGEGIYSRRVCAEMSVRELADAIDRTHPVVLRIEAGDQYPRIPVLYDIARALGCSVHELLPDS